MPDRPNGEKVGRGWNPPTVREKLFPELASLRQAHEELESRVLGLESAVAVLRKELHALRAQAAEAPAVPSSSLATGGDPEPAALEPVMPGSPVSAEVMDAATFSEAAPALTAPEETAEEAVPGEAAPVEVLGPVHAELGETLEPHPAPQQFEMATGLPPTGEQPADGAAEVEPTPSPVEDPAEVLMSEPANPSATSTPAQDAISSGPEDVAAPQSTVAAPEGAANLLPDDDAGPAGKGSTPPAEADVAAPTGAVETTDDPLGEPASAETAPDPAAGAEADRAAFADRVREQYEIDRATFLTQRARAEGWLNNSRALADQLKSRLKTCQDMLGSAEAGWNELAPTIHESLKGRQDGLRLIGKMLERLPQDAAILEEPSGQDRAELPPLEIEHWLAESAGQPEWEQRAREFGTLCWQQVCDQRDLADGRLRRLSSFVQRKVLPIADALADGLTYSAARVQELADAHVDLRDTLSGWLNTYGQVLNQLRLVLASACIREMPVTLGTLVDYERHEPVDTESADGLEDEQIKSVMRAGYVIQAEGEPELILRPAQVIVVKNG